MDVRAEIIRNRIACEKHKVVPAAGFELPRYHGALGRYLSCPTAALPPTTISSLSQPFSTMPPKRGRARAGSSVGGSDIASDAGSTASRGGRGRGRGTRGGRGGVPLVARGGGPAISATSSIAPAAHIQTVGVRRKGCGTAGTAIKVLTNHLDVDIAAAMWYHYDGPCIFFVSLLVQSDH